MRPFIEIRRKRHVVAIVLGIVLFSVAVSLAASLSALSGMPPEFREKSLIVAIVVPIVCATICASPMMTLLYKVTLMRDELAHVAVTDSLTSLNNRRGFFQRSRALLVEGATQRYDCFVIDLDFFKRINDRYGHDAGDKVLAAVGGALAALFTEGEVVGRTGGEEFAVLARWNQERPSAAIGEAIRKRIMCLRIPLDEETLTVTASIGYSSVRSEADLDAALTRADSALYHAKKRGRNRVEAALLAA